MTATPRKPLFFYSQWWPLGEFHNPEAERKAVALSEAGFDVTYMAGTGIRNPRLRSAGKAFDVLISKLRHSTRSSAQRQSEAHPHLATASMMVLPPRQLAPLRRMNTAWLAHQLERSIEPWSEALAWVRYPTPELVSALPRLRPAGIVYECVDAYQHTPGIVGAWEGRLLEAERGLIEQAHAVVVPSEALGERFESLGARDVRLVPHGVDVDLFALREPDRRPDGPVSLGYVGTLDDRLDVPTLRHLAERHHEWTVRLIGPVRDNFDPGLLSDLSNISIEPPVPHERLGEVIADFDVGLMPYLDLPTFTYMCPVKNLEFMAAGKPAVARPNRALMRYADLLYFAETPEEFCAQVERALAEDSAERARRRREVAEENTWERRLNEICDVARELATS